MKNRSFALIALVAVAALLAGPAWNFQQDKKDIQAYIVKVVRDVEKKGPTTGWTSAVNLDQLKAGYDVRTAEKSFALIRFADESKIAVREKSIITISGEVEGRQILNRNVHIDRGRVVFGVKKQQTEQFRFSSPISVASIRGTEGGTGFDPSSNEADITIVTGTADFTSTRTNCSTTIGAGQKGTIDSTGNCNTTQASANDLNNNNPNSSVNQSGEDPAPPPSAKPDTTGSRAGGQRDTTQITPPPPSRAEFALTQSSDKLMSGKAFTKRIALQNPPAVISTAAIFYRLGGEPTFKRLPMTVSNLNVSVEIPQSDIRAGKTKTFEYYLSFVAANGNTYTFPKESPDSNPYSLQIIPKIMHLRIPIADATNTIKYLDISYEE